MSYRLIFLALIAFELSGCADFARSVRQFTYPPEFRLSSRECDASSRMVFTVTADGE